MALKEYYGLAGRITESISSSSLVIPVPPSISGAILDSGFAAGDSSYFSLYAGGLTEIVKLIGVEGDRLVVERGRSGTTSRSFPVGTEIKYQVTTEGVVDAISVSTDVRLRPDGLVQIDKNADNDFTIGVQPPNITGDGGVAVIGTWPDIAIAYEGRGDGCGGSSTSGGSGVTTLVGEGLVTAFVNGDVGTIRVTPLTLTAGTNIQVTGAWPNYTITATAGSGTVGSVGVGAGLVLTGSPTVNPTISMQNTGVAAGTYGGMSINSRGQITAVPLTFNPISVVSAGSNTSVSRVGDNVTINVPNAAVGVRGAVELADETDPFDPSDRSSAATPALVSVALAQAGRPTAEGSSTYAPEPAAEYSNVMPGTAQTITLTDSQKAVIMATATMVDATNPATPVTFGVAVFDSTNILHGDRKISQNQQSVTFVLPGPFSGTVALATTAPPTGATLVSYGLTIVKV